MFICTDVLLFCGAVPLSLNRYVIVPASVSLLPGLNFDFLAASMAAFLRTVDVVNERRMLALVTVPALFTTMATTIVPSLVWSLYAGFSR